MIWLWREKKLPSVSSRNYLILRTPLSGDLDFFRFGVLLPISMISISCVRPVLCEHPSSGPFSIWCDLLAQLLVHKTNKQNKSSKLSIHCHIYIDCFQNSNTNWSEIINWLEINKHAMKRLEMLLPHIKCISMKPPYYSLKTTWFHRKWTKKTSDSRNCFEPAIFLNFHMIALTSTFSLRERIVQKRNKLSKMLSSNKYVKTP